MFPSSCSLCEHLFCSDCLSDSLQSGESSDCPICKQQFKACPIPKKILSIISGLKVSCPIKCEKEFFYSDLNSHLMECYKDLEIKTKCNSCNMEFLDRNKRKNIIQHITNECQTVLVKCKFGCGEKNRRDQLNLHFQSSPNRLILCEMDATIPLAI